MEISAQMRRFLDLIAFSEGTAGGHLDGYGVIVSGSDGRHTFDDFSDHPFANGRAPIVVRENPPLHSTAAGRYQLLYRFWCIYRKQLHLADFSPASQDAVAVQQIRERRAEYAIETGDIEGAITRCSNIWASLPGNAYGQGGKSVAQLLEHYSSTEKGQVSA